MVARKRKDEKTEGRTSNSNVLYYVLAAVAVLAVAIVGYQVGSSAFGPTVTAPVPIDVADDRELVALAQGTVLGDPDAPVTIVEFGDYQCPGCGAFARQVKPLVETGIVDQGRARFVFYDFPLTQMHGNAFLAARAARCAGDQDGYWDYHDMLFQRQAQWSGTGSPASRFVDYAGELGLDEDTFESCLRSDQHAETVTANMRLGEALGVSGTPTVMVSRGQGMANRLMNYDYESIESAVDEALDQGGSGGR